MNRFLPSKKLLVFLGITLVVLGCFVLFFKFKDRKISYLLNKEGPEEIAKMINEISQQTLKNDSDGDGLKDWEEILWKTDPQNSDTDGDGTDDNTEILTKRNPLVAGPNDLLDEDIIASANTESDSEYDKPLTQTDILSRELFTGYVALKQNNQLGTEQEKQFIDNLVTKNLSSGLNLIKKYGLDDLNITQIDDKKTIQRYRDQLNEIYELGNNLEHDIIIVKEALEIRSQQKLNEIDSNIKVYEEVKKQLLSLTVPYKISSLHIDVVNILNNLVSNAEGMKLILNDPITGLAKIKEYIENEGVFREKWRNIGLYFIEKGIKFD